jgi:hypothetical protein
MSPVSSTLPFIRAPLVDKEGKPNYAFLRWLQKLDSKTNKALTLLGELAYNTTVQNHTGSLGDGIKNLDPAGVVLAPGVDFTRSYVSKVLDNIPDGATYARTLGTELTGGKLPQVNSAVSDNSTTTILSQSGTTSTVLVAAFTMQYGRGTVTYNSGSCTASSNNVTGYVYFVDPTYAGGSVTYIFTQSFADVLLAQGSVMVGKITLVPGGGGAGGGGGGTSNGPCFHPSVKVRSFSAVTSIGDLRVGDIVRTRRGPRKIAKVIHREYKGFMCDMGHGELVTPDHHFVCGDFERLASQLWSSNSTVYMGRVCNLEIETDNEDERNYFLENGMLSHNFRPTGC